MRQTMSNLLRDIAPGKWRRIAYVALGSTGTLIAATFAGLTAIDVAAPKWLIFTAAFFGAITGPIWYVPASNVKNDPSRPVA